MLLAAAEPAQRQAWLDGVYRDAALPIAYADDDPTVATSSSTQPSLMARMLEALAVWAGQRVLEIGTGTGYNVALLCERLGSALISTIDVDPALVEAAQTRLRAAGHTPTVAVAGGGGFLDLADASWVRSDTTGGMAVSPKAVRLWDEIEALNDQCVALGFPERDRYG
ncbi:MAG: methyltransferase domain-containing protein [Egibacteraceae bacterium]